MDILRTEIESLLKNDLEDLMAEAFRHRTARSLRLSAAVPGAKRYRSAEYSNDARSFVHASITGSGCELNCRHCQRRVLESMIDVSDPAALDSLGERMLKDHSRGLLLSGGSNRAGEVEFSRHLAAIKRLCDTGIDIIVHTGLIGDDQAEALAEAGVSQALIDIIGSSRTIKHICGLDAEPEAYYRSLEALINAGLEVVPHIVIGIDDGILAGEPEALAAVLSMPVSALVFVIRRGLPAQTLTGTEPTDFAYLCASARLMRPGLPLALGCMRPSGSVQSEFERLAVMSGVDAIAFPKDETIALAKALGLQVDFEEICCSLALTAGVED